MEITALGLFCVLLVLFIFRKPVKKISGFVDSELTTVILESQAENTISANEAYKEMVSELGEDYMSVEDVYRKMTKKRQKSQAQGQAQA